MNKEEAINNILKQIYSKNSTLIITEQQIIEINDFYKANFTIKKYKDFLYKNPTITGLIGCLESGKFEIEKQFYNKKALQPGILIECVYAQTLAKVFGLKKCIDLDNICFNEIPLSCLNFINYLKSSKLYVSAARYLYYNDNNEEEYIVQYGNPDVGDADIIYYNNDIHLEFKESIAKAGEYDLVFDDLGHLIPSDTIKENNPMMIYYINEFNSKTTLFDYLGRNYAIEKNENNDPLNVAINYFKNNNIDLLITSLYNELVAIRPQDLTINDSFNNPIANTKGSEIRTTGRNHSALVSKKFFNTIIKDIAKINGDIYTIPIELNKNGFGWVKERGKETIGRYKINFIFFVKIENIKQENDTIIFNINNVRQTKPSISFHIKIVTNKIELKKIYLK